MNHTEGEPVRIAHSADSQRPQQQLRSLGGPHVTFGTESGERLCWAQKMEALGRLASCLAHEINNRLTIVLARTSLLRINPDTPPAVQAEVADIEQAIDRLEELIRQWLTLSRKEARGARRTDLNRLISGVLPVLQAALGERIDLFTECLALPDLVRAEPGQVEQILINLVLNARDAMTGRGMVTLTTSNVWLDESAAQFPLHVPPGPYVLLVVRDSGCGMDQATRARIFEPFFTTKAPGRGTGMGLFTVWESLKELGGTLRVTSAPGQGSTFSIYFPQVRDNSESLAQQRQETSTLVAPTILVLGVEEVVRTLVCRILNREGYHVLEACHASEAEHLGRDSAAAVQLLILDSQVQAAGDIVSLLRDRCPHLKVLHLVNDLVGERIHEGTDLATAVLSKPFLPHVLIDKVRGLLNCDQRSVASRP